MKWCIAGTYIHKKPGTSWMETMPGGLNLPPRTAAFNYLRVHGARGYKGTLSESQLIYLRKALRAQKLRDLRNVQQHILRFSYPHVHDRRPEY